MAPISFSVEDEQRDDDADERHPEIDWCSEEFAHQGGKQSFHNRTFSMSWSSSDIT